MSENGSGVSISTLLNIFCVSNHLPTHFSRILKILPFFATHYQNRLPTSCSHAIRQYIGCETGDQRTSRIERIITNEWLQQFQKQSEAWEVASELLKDDNMLVVFFGAHTLCKYVL